jgi:hypothetical protein
MSLEDYMRIAKRNPYIEPLASHCGEPLEVLHVEPLERRSIFEVRRTCIVKCKKCKKHFWSYYD